MSAKLLEPYKHLSSEASDHVGRIRRFAPTGFVPWNNSGALASAVVAVERKDIMDCYDRIVLGKSRSRIVSCVYGSKFPFAGAHRLGADFGAKVLTNEEEARKAGNALKVVDRRRKMGGMAGRIALGIGVGVLVGVGAAGLVYLKKGECRIGGSKKK